MEGMTIDALHISKAQHLILVGTQLIVLQANRQRIGMHDEVINAKQSLLQFARLVIVDVELAFLE